MGSNRTTTYDPKQVIAVAGSHAISGFADDGFITIEAKGDGITSKVGCDGEVARAVSPDRTFTVKISLLQNSMSNSFFQNMLNKDRETAEGTFPLSIKDLRGGMVFSADTAWVVKDTSRTFGKDTNNREWTIETGPATMTE